MHISGFTAVPNYKNKEITTVKNTCFVTNQLAIDSDEMTFETYFKVILLAMVSPAVSWE